jgi:hypothetical protein
MDREGGLMKVDKYSFRVPGEDVKVVGTAELTDELLHVIAYYNGSLSPEKVREYLNGGYSVYTNFHFYRKAEEEAFAA